MKISPGNNNWGQMKISPGKVSPSLLSHVKSQYQLNSNEVILVGKNGGLKERMSGLDLERLFNDIDRIPMRVREMRKQPI